MNATLARLGLGANARVLIPHVDDVGLCHGANQAFIELSRDGFITCGSVMVPCPWFREMAAVAAAEPGLDLGVHLTLTSERSPYRWAPISTVSRASGLIDDEGYFWRTVPELRAHLVPEAAEAEMRAQIDRALAAGIDVTHLDAHMGAALVPELVGIYMRLGRTYRLPALLPRAMEGYLSVLKMGPADAAGYDGLVRRMEEEGQPIVDRFEMTPNEAPAAARAAYEAIVARTPPGITFLATHCNAPGEIEFIAPHRARQRIEEYELFRGPGFRDFAAGRGVRLLGMRALRDALRSGRSA